MASPEAGRGTDLLELEEEALEHFAEWTEAPVAAAVAERPAVEEIDQRTSIAVRNAVATAFPTVAAAVMVGGVFIGADARAYAAAAGLLGIALAFALRRVRGPVVVNATLAAGLFAIGLLMLVPTGLANVPDVANLVGDAVSDGDVLRPPVPFTSGWNALLGWLLAMTGCASAWVAVVLRRPGLGLLLPMPVAALGAISVPDDQQVTSGAVVLVLFAVGLGVLSGTQAVGSEDQRLPAGYELRRALRALPLLAVMTVVVVLLSRANFLFPDPFIDPTKEPQKPKTTPLSEVEDRVLFTVDSSLSGPWRLGSLDVYERSDGTWRLPPFAENELVDVPKSGIVDRALPQGVKATFTVAGLEGAVLPGLPNTVGISAEGPKLVYDARNGNIRVSEGQVRAGLRYTVTAAPLPSIDDLRLVTSPVPAEIRRFSEIPDPPPAVRALLDRAEAEFDNTWDRFDFLRTYVLENVVATGVGMPVAVPPARVADMLAGSREGSPYEIVAAQAMLARWIGLPSRLAYGFDGGEIFGDLLQIRPKHGATFVEVYFPGYKWLPVIGTPRQAKPTVGGDSALQRFDPSVIPSEDASVSLILPVATRPPSTLGRDVLITVVVVAGVLVVVALAFALWPVARKAVVRSRRRSAAAAAGPRARVALTYAEWRDHATDFGFHHPADTPLMFLDRCVDDPEHAELAWLVTRALWGDLGDHLTPKMAASAEELSRNLRRRLAGAQPATVRAVAAMSRLSLRRPYAPDTDLTGSERETADVVG